MDEQTAKKKLLSPEKVTIGAIVSFLFLIFGAIVVFSAQYGESSTTNSTTATPAPEGLFQAGAQSNLSAKQQPQQPQQQVQGAQTQMKVEPPAPTTPPIPTSSPTPVPTPTPMPSPSSSPSPSPSSSSNDSEGPKLSGISAENVESNKATIKFTASEDAEAKIEYGDNTSYGKTKEVTDKKTSHSIELSDLEANKTYHYRIIGKDGSGNSTTSGDNEFTTKP